MNRTQVFALVGVLAFLLGRESNRYFPNRWAIKEQERLDNYRTVLVECTNRLKQIDHDMAEAEQKFDHAKETFLGNVARFASEMGYESNTWTEIDDVLLHTWVEE